ncbi:MAG: alkaline phosphatase family protein [Thermoproteus sp. AZ2]|jgi:predicted AlkP superfamily pyrophosphatase or phosphodiesterase|uniref:Alkaline phosphatase family protein n=1 Tax=Thermoproteus sp. AZ2 TaxID=1609232 RepID=A0ACC6UZF7_9CREN|nr:MAG: phosphodiesterase [Thermoproteus sp. AZ2]
MEAPKYDGLSIANIPNSILEGFGLRPRGEALSVDLKLKDRVALVLLDGLGYDELVRAAGDLASRYSLSAKITSVFPTTTATALTSLSTGLTPCEHGVVAWSFYLKQVGAVIDSLFMSPFFWERDGLYNAGYDLRSLFEAPTIFSALSGAGLKARAFLPRGLGGGISRVLYDGAEVFEYVSPFDAFVNAGRFLRSERGLAYIYISTIDSVLHKYGPGTEESSAAIAGVLEEVEKLSSAYLAGASLIITADHGHERIEENINLSKDGELLSLLDVPPHGDPRAVFLKTRRGPEELKAAVAKYGFQLIDRGAAASSGLLGRCNGRFEERYGDFIAFPPSGKAALYLYRPKNEDPLKFKGHHGGLSSGELYVPLLVRE